MSKDKKKKSMSLADRAKTVAAVGVGSTLAGFGGGVAADIVSRKFGGHGVDARKMAKTIGGINTAIAAVPQVAAAYKNRKKK